MAVTMAREEHGAVAGNLAKHERGRRLALGRANHLPVRDGERRKASQS